MRKIFIASIFVFASCAFAFGQNPNCPKIYITGPSSVPQENEPVTFTVSVDEKAKDLKLEYVWTVSGGKIIKGRKTQAVTVEWSLDFAVTATVEIKGLPEGCPNTDSESMIGDPTPKAKFIDEFLFADSKIDPAKFDKIIAALKNDAPDDVYIIIYNNEKTPAEKIGQQEKLIRKIIEREKISPDRIVIVSAGEKENLIRLWLVPAGAAPPMP